MGAAIRNGSVTIACILVLQQIPHGRDLKIPDNYRIAYLAQTVLSMSQQIIDSTPTEPAGWTDVTWPFRRIFSRTTELVKYTIFDPFAFLLKLVHGDFKSAPQLAEENVELLKEHNVVYQQEQDKLKPVDQALGEIVQNVKTGNQALESENLELSLRVETFRVEGEDLIQMLNEPDLEELQKNIQQVINYVGTNLTDPEQIKEFETYEQNLIFANHQLAQVMTRIQTSQKSYEEKITILFLKKKENEQIQQQCIQHLKETKMLKFQ